MDIEFHYYVTWFLAQEAGFPQEDCAILAYACQYTDDNDQALILDVHLPPPQRYETYVSQTMDISKPKQELMRIYPCFHFVPGNHELVSARRSDGKMHILNTTPDNSRARKLISEAFKTHDLCRMGIAVHAYADTWAHQNFAGWFDYFNGMGGLFERLTPNIGHADALHCPDVPGLIWKDERLSPSNSMVSNKNRFLAAAERIYYRLRKHISPRTTGADIEAEWRPIKEKLSGAIGEEFEGNDGRSAERVKRYKALLHEFKAYDPKEWFNQAVKVRTLGLPDGFCKPVNDKIQFLNDRYVTKEGFAGSRWFQFQEAVKAHQALAKTLLAGLFDQMGVAGLKEF